MQTLYDKCVSQLIVIRKLKINIDMRLVSKCTQRIKCRIKIFIKCVQRVRTKSERTSQVRHANQISATTTFIISHFSGSHGQNINWTCQVMDSIPIIVSLYHLITWKATACDLCEITQTNALYYIRRYLKW